MKLIATLKGLFQIGKRKAMIEDDELEIEQPKAVATNIDFKEKTKKGNVIKVHLNDQERAILQSFTKSPFFNELIVYFNQILLEGTIYEKDANKIDDFIVDWLAENPEQPLPKTLQFIQVAIVPKINGEYSDASTIPPGTLPYQPQQVQQTPHTQYAQPDIVFDDENLPSYLPKIHDIIEKEVRRRVRVEMREYNKLKIEHNELIAKMADISKLFSPK